LLSLHSLLDLRIPFSPVARLGDSNVQHYPEWRARRKPKGQRDRSLKQRSNRRKAVARR